MSNINDIREGWRHPNLRISGVLVTKLDKRVRSHNHLLEELKGHSVLGKLLLGVIPANEAVSYAHHNHLSVFNYDPKAPASRAHAQLVGALVRRMSQRGA
jgi:cellulose biosynthesis protein BcsQ